MFGIQDTYVWLAYALCLASAVLCVIYGAINWNRGDDSIRQEDVQWAAHEDDAEKDLG